MKNQHLQSFQNSGVDFLLTKYKANQSCVLNDESQLGKTVQLVHFIQTICKNDDSKKILIIVPTSTKLKYWKYHLDTFSHLTYTEISELDGSIEISVQNSQIILTQHDCHTLITNHNWDLVILEDVQGRFVEDLMESIKNHKCVFKTAVDITLHLDQLYLLAKHCLKSKMPLTYGEFSDRYNVTLKDGKLEYFKNREKLLTMCRSFRIRRRKFEVLHELPLTDPVVFIAKFDAWKSSQMRNPPKTKAPKLVAQKHEPEAPAPLKPQISDPMFDFACIERDTQQMSPLIFESESEAGASQDPIDKAKVENVKSKANMVFAKISLSQIFHRPSNLVIPEVSPPASPVSIAETQQSEHKDEFNDGIDEAFVDHDQYGQTFNTQCSFTSSPEKLSRSSSCTTIKDEIFTQFLDKEMPKRREKSVSTDVEFIGGGLNTPIYVSSSNSNLTATQPRPKCVSPDLFGGSSDEEEEEEEQLVLNSTEKTADKNPPPATKNHMLASPFYSPLINDQSNFLDIINKSNVTAISFSTPSHVSSDLSNADSNRNTKSDAKSVANSEENVFEITKNEEFCNVLRINSDTEMSPIRVSTDSDEEEQDRDKPSASTSSTTNKRKIFDLDFLSNKRLHVAEPVLTPPVILELLDSDAEERVNNTTPESSPHHLTPANRISSKKSKSSAICKTDSPVTPKTASSRTSSGWLSKSPKSANKTVSPCRKYRRRRLDSMFGRTVIPCSQRFGGDVMLNEPCSAASRRSQRSVRLKSHQVISPDSDY